MQNKEQKERADQTEELEKTIITLERTREDKNVEGQLREQLLDVIIVNGGDWL